MKKKLEWFIVCLGSFFLLFSFKVPVVVNSAVLIGFIITPFILYRARSRGISISYKDVGLCISVYSMMLFFLALIAISHETYDFSAISAIFSILAALYSIVVFSAYVRTADIYNSEDDKLYFFSKLIFYVFLTQAIIISLSVSSEVFHKFIQLFQSADDAERAQKYMGARGLALSGAQFFPLTALYSVAQVFMLYYIINKDKVGIIDALAMALIFATGMTAGRTSLIGTCAFIILFLIFSTYKYKVFLGLSKVIVVGGVIGIIIYNGLLGEKITEYIFDIYLPFAFEFVYSFFDGRGGGIESTDVLSRMYWFPGWYELLIGYGYYSLDDGTTFMSTDGGYMRNILFGGIFGVILPVFGTVALITRLKKNINVNASSTLTIYTVLILLLILHYKGDVLLHLVSVQSLILMAILLSSKKARSTLLIK
ncbi:hypothetical protein [Aeromonas caviae]|uniref:hypothetical protein n=1 Tax=Aeromonas caviae TaxID=648 RepID=UPI002B47A91E|nr:hypothetical protein [Aeromonas caviae]